MFAYTKGQSSLSGASAVASLTASLTSAGWSTNWAVPDRLTDGDFEAVAVAIGADSNETARSALVTFSYKKSVTLAPLQAVMTLPKSGTRLSQVANISATVSRKADDVSFIVSGGDTVSGQPLVLKGSSDQDGLIWSYTWDTTSQKNGIYGVMAKASSQEETVTSDAVEFAIANQVTTTVPSVEVSVVTPADGEMLSGNYEFHATTGEKVDSLIFVVARVDVAGSITNLRVLAGDSTGQVTGSSPGTRPGRPTRPIR